MAAISPDLALLQAPAQQDSTIPPNDPQLQQSPEEIALQQQQQEAEAALDDTKENELLFRVVELAEKEDEQIRYLPLLRAKRNEYYFNNIQKIFFDEGAKDFRTIDSISRELSEFTGNDDVKMVNVYRAYAESIIASLSISLPATEFTPDDADNPDDVETAKAYSEIAELIGRHNHGQLMLVKALCLFFNQGIVAAYNYYRTDPAYGTFSKPGKTEPRARDYANLYCQACGELVNSNVPKTAIPPQVTCPNCKTVGQPNVIPKIEYIDEVVEWEDTPKGRVGYDLYGMTAVKIPLYAKKQSDCGYVILRVDDHIAKWKTVYDTVADKIVSGGGDTYKYERWARLSPEYFETIPTEIATGRFAFIRPWYFNVLQKEEADWLIQRYPQGVMVGVIGTEIVEKKSEKLDDRWTISFDPRASYIHAEPAGNALVPLQDATTDIFNLGLQSIEYGIPETFVHPKTLNFQKYKSTVATPGMMTPAMPYAEGKSLSDGFYTNKAATLSNEYSTFAQQLRTLTEFVSGAMPSIFGGQLPNGSDTATEYTESRNRALQRLQIVWQIISVFWSDLTFKACKNFQENLQEDERYTDKKNGTFINVWIRKSSLQGKVGHVEPETNGQLPQSWSQKKDFITSLIQLQNPEIGQILLHPNNSENLKQITGMPDFYIPGENDRNKQYTEFYLLSQGQPISDKEPSIPVDIDVDDHAIHKLVLKNILVSSQGTQLYQTNPVGYQNCILHYRMHELAEEAKTMQIGGGTPAGQPPATAKTSQEG